MKNFIFLILCSFLFIGCGSDRDGTYTLKSSGLEIPDSNKQKFSEFIQKTVSAASLHMTGGDYEDPQYVIREATMTAYELYGVPKLELCYYDGDWCNTEKNMTVEKIRIYDSLLRNFKR